MLPVCALSCVSGSTDCAALVSCPNASCCCLSSAGVLAMGMLAEGSGISAESCAAFMNTSGLFLGFLCLP